MITTLARSALLGVLLAACAGPPPAPETAVRVPPEVRAKDDRQLVVTFPDAGIAVRTAAGASPRPYAGFSGYDGSAHAQWLAARLAREYGMRRVVAWHIGSLGVHCVVFEADDAAGRDGLLERLRSDPRVESAQPMVTFETLGEAQGYDDPLFPLQTSVAVLQVPEAHAWAQGRDVRVAVIDTGIDTRHPDLTDRVRGTWNFVDDDADGFRADRHGTAVAGVLAAVARNGLGIVGVAPAVEILAIKACWEPAAGAPGRCNTLTLAAALDLAINEDVRVINLSLGGPEDRLLARLVRAALERGIVVVGPAGRSGDHTRGFPAGVGGVIAIADADDPAPATGPADTSTLAAPGQHVLTLVPGGRFDFVSGESYSTAMVSGIAALLLERRELDPPEVMKLLATTTVRRGSAGGAVVNACLALATVAPSVSCGNTLVTAGAPGQSPPGE